MKTNPLKEGKLTLHSEGIGTVTRKMVRERAVELAMIDGRSENDVSKSDWDQAKRELTGEPKMDTKEDTLESSSESDRWNMTASSTGRAVPTNPSEDEDAEGRSDQERLTNEGIAGAEHDQMLQAAKVQTENG